MKLSISSPNLSTSLKLRKHNNDSGGMTSKKMTLILPRVDQVSRPVSIAISIALLMVIILVWDFWLRQEFREEVKKSGVSRKKEFPFEVTSKEVIFALGTGSFVTVTPKKPLKYAAVVGIVFDDPDIVDTIGTFTIQKNSTRSIFIPLHSKKLAGHCTMSFKSNSLELKELFKQQIHIKVVHDIYLGYLGIVIGWCYFIFWSVVYYPQIYKNYKRQSVVGLSFDYLSINFTGHICYCIFNMAMYCNSTVQKEFTKLHPKALLPVRANDVFFSCHAVCMNIIIITQCCLYEREGQKVAPSALTLVCGLWLSIVAGLIGCITEKFNWLRYLYYLSYIKVGTTPIKYTPQVYMHWLRKSTEGWSVHSLMLDVSGGILSFTEMILDAVNNDDWDGTLGNPGKLGLSIVAMIFDCIFLTQHFVLYPSGRKRRPTAETQTPFKARLNTLQTLLATQVQQPHSVYDL